MFTHTGVNFTNVYYFLELHYYLGTTMLDLIERTKTLIANHPEYMRQNTPCNIPGGHGQRFIRHSEKVNPYYKKLCSFDMSPEYASQIMFAQDFRINANKVVVRQTELDAFPAMRPNVSGDPILLTAAEVIDTFNKLIHPNTKSVRRILNQSEIRAIMGIKLMVPTDNFYNFFIQSVNKFMIMCNEQDTSKIMFSFDDGTLSSNFRHFYNVFKHYKDHIQKMK